jgi:hypothetical protein
MVPVVFNDTVKRGDTAKWQLTFFDKNGAPLNLTGAVVRCYAKAAMADADIAALVRVDSAGLGGITITDAGNGVALMTWAPALLTAFQYDVGLYWDVQVTEQNGDVTTVIVGVVTITMDVTRTS